MPHKDSDAMKSNSTIFFLGPCYPYRGGIASFTERLARSFQQKGFQTELQTFTLQYPDFLFPGKTQFSQEPAPEDLFIRRTIHTLNPFNWLKTGLDLRKAAPELILVRYWIPFLAPALGCILRLARGNRKTRIVCLADNIIPHESRPGDKILTRFFNGAIDGYVVMSQQVKKDLDKLGIKKPVRLIPHPLFDHFGNLVDIDWAKLQLNVKPDRKIILFFGLIRKYKGVDLLIQAMDKPQVRQLNLQLIIAGECYDDVSNYEKLIHDLGLGSQITLMNEFIPENKIPILFSAADVLIQPYRHATQSGVTPLAMHFDLPMIVTRVGGLQEMVQEGKTGEVTEPNPDALAEGIIHYFNKGKLHYQSHLPAFKNRFSWEVMADGIIELSDSLSLK